MNLLHLSWADTVGGAAQASHRLHRLLRSAGHHSVMAVRRKESSDPDVVPVRAKRLRDCGWAEGTERARTRLAGGYRVASRPFCEFNPNVAPVPDWEEVWKAMPAPDVVFLHWMDRLVTAADIRRLSERVHGLLVWVLMDLEPMTGGCHYPGSCAQFEGSCFDCPQLLPGRGANWAGRLWREKQACLGDLPITFVVPTRWQADRLARSGLFRANPSETIPLPVDERMRPLDKGVARQVLDLPLDRKVVLVGSQNLRDPRKGMDRLVAAVRLLRERWGACEECPLCLLLGGHGEELARELPVPCRTMGYVRGGVELALAYQAADVFACSSLEDAGPMMLSQAMMCGTAVVAFDGGIAPELLADGEGGYLAQWGDAGDFARGLLQVLGDSAAAGARASAIAARHHDPHAITAAYGRLLERLAAKRSERQVP